jgi:MutS domain V
MSSNQLDPDAESPRAAYERSLQEKQAELSVQQRRDRALGFAKLAVGLVAVFLVVRFVHELHGIWPLVIVLAAFVVLIVVHERVLKRVQRIKVLINFYERGVARLEGRWAGTGETGERFIDPTHPYARDLDILGRGSLFELLCTLRTRAGEETLAQWLLTPAEPEEICARQSVAQELRNRNEFRERLFTAGNRVRLGVHPERLIPWGEGEWSFGSRWLSVLLAILAVLWVVSVVYGLLRNNYYPLLLSSLVNWIVRSQVRKRMTDSVFAVEDVTADLDLLAEVLEMLEREHFESEKLVALQSALSVDGVSPSAAVEKLDRIVHNLLQRENLAVRWFIGFIFYTEQVAMMAESWRKKFGRRVRAWLEIVGEMEALAALACYAFEHPNDAWPEIIDGPARFEAEAFAHPLLPEKDAIRNDLMLGTALQLIILSGPNMSGKSTFIRGIGVNAVLAQCGGPVRAKRIRMSPLAVGASICILDSLSGGVSRFYAEIKRLKLISDLAHGSRPLLFLLDELLSGTNSHDRLEGTKFVVQSLVSQGAIGLVTTHDLALAEIPANMNGIAGNYHFEDRLENEKLVFDFVLKPGVVQTSNALKLMESIGLVAERPPSRSAHSDQ